MVVLLPNSITASWAPNLLFLSLRKSTMYSSPSSAYLTPVIPVQLNNVAAV